MRSSTSIEALSADDVAGMGKEGGSRKWIVLPKNIDFIIAIVVWGWADGPARNTVAGKGAFAMSLWFVDDGLGSKRR